MFKTLNILGLKDRTPTYLIIYNEGYYGEVMLADFTRFEDDRGIQVALKSIRGKMKSTILQLLHVFIVQLHNIFSYKDHEFITKFTPALTS